MAQDRQVLIYTAQVRLSLEHSNLEYVEGISREELSTVIRAAPSYQPDGWPPLTKATDDAELEEIALRKIKRVFDIGLDRQERNKSAEQIGLSIRDRWPQVTNRIDHGPIDPSEFKAYKIVASIWDNGEASWEYSFGPGPFPPSVTTAVTEGDGSQLDKFLQDIVRMDLQARIEKLRAAYPNELA